MIVALLDIRCNNVTHGRCARHSKEAPAVQSSLRYRRHCLQPKNWKTAPNLENETWISPDFRQAHILSCSSADRRRAHSESRKQTEGESQEWRQRRQPIFKLRMVYAARKRQACPRHFGREVLKVGISESERKISGEPPSHVGKPVLSRIFSHMDFRGHGLFIAYGSEASA